MYMYKGCTVLICLSYIRRDDSEYKLKWVYTIQYICTTESQIYTDWIFLPLWLSILQLHIGPSLYKMVLNNFGCVSYIYWVSYTGRGFFTIFTRIFWRVWEKVGRSFVIWLEDEHYFFAFCKLKKMVVVLGKTHSAQDTV